MFVARLSNRVYGNFGNLCYEWRGHGTGSIGSVSSPRPMFAHRLGALLRIGLGNEFRKKNYAKFAGSCGQLPAAERYDAARSIQAGE
jgi:hypothetical protein